MESQRGAHTWVPVDPFKASLDSSIKNILPGHRHEPMALDDIHATPPVPSRHRVNPTSLYEAHPSPQPRDYYNHPSAKPWNATRHGVYPEGGRDFTPGPSWYLPSRRSSTFQQPRIPSPSSEHRGRQHYRSPSPYRRPAYSQQPPSHHGPPGRSRGNDEFVMRPAPSQTVDPPPVAMPHSTGSNLQVSENPEHQSQLSSREDTDISLVISPSVPQPILNPPPLSPFPPAGIPFMSLPSAQHPSSENDLNIVSGNEHPTDGHSYPRRPHR
ncbi:hypothetical protein BDZ97DRAFT_1815520 [Flammula alnicola]|nr:hypothetical protein BDZ97DRAFT_1815520 [Flammula alnicola]